VPGELIQRLCWSRHVLDRNQKKNGEGMDWKALECTGRHWKELHLGVRYKSYVSRTRISFWAVSVVE